MPSLARVDHLSEPDRAAVRALVDDVARRTGHPALPDNKAVQVAGRAPFDGFAILAREPDRVTGYAHAARAGDDNAWNLQVVVAPEEVSDLGLPLLSVAMEEAASRGARRLQWFTFRAGPAEAEVASRLGLSPWRELVQMRRGMPLDEEPRLPEGVRLRAFRPGPDDEVWVAVNARAFATHPEQSRVTVAELRALMAEEWFDSEGFLVAEDDAGMAGFCWTKVADPSEGEIYVIGVDPDRQGTGLGRALVVAGLAHIAAQGAAEASLYVDGDNAAARALYENLGFHVDHVDRVYACDR